MEQKHIEDSNIESVQYIFESIYPNRQMMELLEKIHPNSEEHSQTKLNKSSNEKAKQKSVKRFRRK